MRHKLRLKDFLFTAYLRVVFTNDRVGVKSRKSAYDLVKIKNGSRKRSHKGVGVGVGLIRTFPFSSNSDYDSVAYDLMKTRLSEPEAEAEG